MKERVFFFNSELTSYEWMERKNETSEWIKHNNNEKGTMKVER